jgi:dephospho-CoA kinase
MFVLGLTGGIGMGKSTAALLLRQRNLPVIDTDEIARDLTEPGTPAVAAIANQFGPVFITPEGGLDRARLAREIFTNREARTRLEMILHPPIRAVWLAKIEQLRGEPCPMAVVVIPLLFETAASEYFDRVACIACSPASQRNRLSLRGWTAEHIDQRNAAQWPIEKKILMSDYLIWTEGPVEVHAAQLDLVLARHQSIPGRTKT